VTPRQAREGEGHEVHGEDREATRGEHALEREERDDAEREADERSDDEGDGVRAFVKRLATLEEQRARHGREREQERELEGALTTDAGPEQRGDGARGARKTGECRETLRDADELTANK
jgi:hypothetical protein